MRYILVCASNLFFLSASLGASHLAPPVVHLPRDVGVQVLQDARHQPAQGVRLGVARVEVVLHHGAGPERRERFAGARLADDVQRGQA